MTIRGGKELPMNRADEFNLSMHIVHVDDKGLKDHPGSSPYTEIVAQIHIYN